jgi:DNA-binding IclR family transcriptional regulator
LAADDLPEDVQKLLRDHIESYEQLELLVLLRTELDHRWTVDALSARFRIPASLASLALDELQTAGFVEPRGHGPEKQYAYLTQSNHVEATLERLIQAYREYPIPILRQMSANAIERVRTAALRRFADAFILRKDKKDG